MKKIVLFFIALFPVVAGAQGLIRNQDEPAADFVNRMAPPGAGQISLLMEDKFNSKEKKIISSYVLYESGNLINDKDSSLSYYLEIFSPLEDSAGAYSVQKIKMLTSYKKRTRIEKADVITADLEKQLQIYIAEFVRGPGGVPRDVKRTLVYKQDKEDGKYIDHFSEAIKK